MNETIMTEHPTSASPASIVRAVINQRRAVVLAAVLVAAAFWVAGPVGEWQSGTLFAAGVVLGLVNHVLTEYAIQKAVASQNPVTRNAYARSSLIRLGVISLAALGLVLLVGRDGIFVLFGLAIFHLIALALTAIPLLREVRNQ